MDNQDMVDMLDRRVERRGARREFFRSALGAAAIGAAGVSALTLGRSAMAQAVTDEDILNFALNLEYLEANFYHFAAFGTPIPDNLMTGTGAQGAATGGRQVNFTDNAVRAYAREIANDELAHVAFLRTALGGSAVAQPQIDVGTMSSGAFSTAARAAGLVGNGEAFDAYATDENFLLAAFIFEDVGVTAYKGAAPLISNTTYLEAAAGILAVEAYHAAIIRTTLYAKGMDARSAADAISGARDSLDGSTDLDQGISPTDGDNGTQSNIVPLDDDGIAFSRDTGQVLNIVYLNTSGSAATAGGFFPAGVNGTINTGMVAAASRRR